MEEVHLSGCATYRKDAFEPSRFVYEMGLLSMGEDAQEVQDV